MSFVEWDHFTSDRKRSNSYFVYELDADLVYPTGQIPSDIVQTDYAKDGFPESEMRSKHQKEGKVVR